MLQKKKLNDPTTMELGISSVHKYVYNHVLNYHFIKCFNDHPNIKYINHGNNGETFCFIVSIKNNNKPYYIDMLIMDIFDTISPVLKIEKKSD